MNRKPFNRKRVAGHLSNALGSVTAALIAVGDLPIDPASDALEEVMRIHRGVLQARKAFRKRLDSLLAAARSEGERLAVLAFEEAANAVGWNCADAGFRLGLLDGWAAGRTERDRVRKRPSRLGRKLPGEAEE